jgi:hypothetical protein
MFLEIILSLGTLVITKTHGTGTIVSFLLGLLITSKKTSTNTLPTILEIILFFKEFNYEK